MVRENLTNSAILIFRRRFITRRSGRTLIMMSLKEGKDTFFFCPLLASIKRQFDFKMVTVRAKGLIRSRVFSR